MKTSPMNCHSENKFREFASFDSPSMFLRHPEHTQDLQHISESDCHGIQCSTWRISLHSREGWAGGQCTSVGRSPWIWEQTGNLGSKEDACSPAALGQSTKEHLSMAWNREVGSPQNHQPFPLRASVVLALCFLSLNWRWSLLWMWRDVTVPSQTEFLLQSVVSVTSPHCTPLIACFIFGILVNYPNTFTSHNWELTVLSVLGFSDALLCIEEELQKKENGKISCWVFIAKFFFFQDESSCQYRSRL